MMKLPYNLSDRANVIDAFESNPTQVIDFLVSYAEQKGEVVTRYEIEYILYRYMDGRDDDEYNLDRYSLPITSRIKNPKFKVGQIVKYVKKQKDYYFLISRITIEGSRILYNGFNLVPKNVPYNERKALHRRPVYGILLEDVAKEVTEDPHTLKQLLSQHPRTNIFVNI